VPAASGGMAASTRGAHGIPPTRETRGFPSASAKPRAPRNLVPVLRGREGGGDIRPAGHRSDLAGVLGRGAFIPPVPRVANVSEARGHRTREPRWGDGGADLCERRGAPRRIALSGRGRRSVRSQRLGRRKAAPSHPRCRQTKNRHAETTKKRTAHPFGKTRPSRKGRRTSHEPRQAVRAGLSVVTAETTVPGASSHSRGSTAASSCSSSSTGLERSSTTRSSPGISSGGSNSLSCPW